MNTPSQRAIQLERRAKLGFFVSSLVLLFLLITQVSNMLVSFLFAFVVFYLLAPTVDFFERRGLSRIQATLIPFLSLAIVVVGAIAIFTPNLLGEIQGLKSNLPQYQVAMGKMFSGLQSQFLSVFDFVGPLDLQEKVESQLMGLSSVIFQQLPEYVSRSLTILLLAPFLAFFMLLNGRDFMRDLVSMVPNNFYELVIDLIHQIGSQFGGFIRARLIESLIFGAVLWLGLAIIGFPYAIVLAIFASVLNIIPYLGPLIGAVPPIIIAMANGGDHTVLAEIFFIYFGMQVFDATVLVPFLVAKIVDLHPVTVVLAILVGSQLMGVIGMIICIPVVAALKVTSVALYRHFTGFRT